MTTASRKRRQGRGAGAKGGPAAAPARARSARWQTGRWPPGRRRAALAVVLGLSGMLLLARLTPVLSTIGDNAEYIVIAESILAGHGLAHESDPELKPETKYPPVYPALLAPIVAAAPGGTIPLKLFTIACALVALWLAFLLVESRAGTLMGALVALLTALNANFLNFSQEVLAEIPYLAMTLAALWFLEAAARTAAPPARDPAAPPARDPAAQRSGDRAAWIALAFAVLASNTRTVGLGLGIAVFIYYLLVRRPRFAAGWFGLFVLLNLPWFIRNRMLGTAGTYAEQLMMKNPYRPWLGQIGPADLIERVRENFSIYVQHVVPELFYSPTGTLPPASQGLVAFIGFALTAAILGGIWLHLRRRPRALEIYVLFFSATCLIWPQVWSSVRFLVPVVPLLLYYAVDFARMAGGRLASRSPGFSSPRVVAGVILALLGLQAIDTAKALGAPRGLTPDWVSYYAAADWVGGETPKDSIIACRSTYLFYLRAHRKTVGYVFSEKPAEVLKSLTDQHATHVVVDAFMWTGTTMRYLIPALQSRQELFEPVHQTADPVTWVLAIRGAAAGPAPAPPSGGTPPR